MTIPTTRHVHFALDRPIHVADIGAAMINEAPPYKRLVEAGLAHLSAFEPDERHQAKLIETFGERVTLYPDAIADGATHTLRICPESSGMTSIMRPSKPHLSMLTMFEILGMVLEERPIATRRLDDIATLPPIDFLKMDIQGAELMAMENGRAKLAETVAIWIEVQFVPLYENQATFGDIDVWMRAQGFMPHVMPIQTKWCFAPHGPPAVEAKQLFYADIVYVRDPTRLGELSVAQVIRLLYLATFVFETRDFADYLIRHLDARGVPGA